MVREVQAARAAGTDRAGAAWRHPGTLQAARAAGRLLGATMLARDNPALTLMYIANIVIILSNDTEVNPGPRQPKYPCQICEKAVTWKQRGVACDDCDQWYHVECMHMSTPVYLSLNNVSWHCTSCGMPNFSTSLFDTTIISNNNSFSALETSATSETSQSSPGPPLQSSSPTTANRNKKPPSYPMKVIVINFQSIKNKKEEVLNLIDQADPSIILGTETWLTPQVSSSEIFPPNYEVIRKDRKDGYGGVLIAVKKDYTANIIEDNSSNECSFVRLNLGPHTSLFVGSVYRPPSSDLTYMDQLCGQIENLYQNNKKAVFWIGGDTNLPDINWKDLTAQGNRVNSDINGRFLDMLQNCGMEQIVQFPTRGENTLDIFATNRPGLINRCTPIPGLSDHDAIIIESSATAQRNKPVKRKIHLWKRANLPALKSSCLAFQRNFFNKFNNLAANNSGPLTETMWNDIKQNLQNIIETNVPSKQTSIRFSQPWINSDIKRLSRKKRKLYNIARRTQDPSDLQRYKNIKTTTREACRKAYKDYIEHVISPDCTSNPKRFWSFINSKKTESVGVSALKSTDGLTYSDTMTKANILNNQFSSVFNTNECTSNIQEVKNVSTTMDKIIVTENGVAKLLKNLKIHKASGPDGLSTRLLKELANELAPIFTALFQTSLSEGTLPSEWKKADVVPIYKKGAKNKAENYRPVSLTSVTCKLLEHIITSNMMRYLERNNILTDLQHGFRRKRSCETQLITTVQDLAKTMDDKGQTDLILLDFSKAFDKVPHVRLMHKLHQYGIRGSTHKWIKDFLSNRSQEVVLEGKRSLSAPVNSGVPQGSVLGPSLFLIYINDLPSYLSQGSTARLFADDCVLYRTINNTEDAKKLQIDLNELQRWERDWLMEFHPQKCQVLHITNQRNPIKSSYTIHNQILNPVDSAKYLGVTLNNKLSWNPHINQITKKANNTRAFLQRNIHQCPSSTKALCYKTLVRPQLEYASTVWDPFTSTNRDQIEMVQRRAARFVTGNYHRTSSVNAMLEKLKWETLEHRRKIAKVLMIYKIKRELVACTSNILVPATTTTLRGHDQKYLVPYTRTQVYMESFYPDAIRIWNNLPPEAVACKTYEAFKTAIAKHFPSGPAVLA